jgi:hypothetical protein
MKIIREESKFTITDYKWDNKYSYGNYFRDDDHGPRTYKVGEKKVPSVTTILNATQSPEKRKHLWTPGEKELAIKKLNES